MKDLKKRFTIAVSFGFLLLGLAACNSNQQADPATPGTDTTSATLDTIDIPLDSLIMKLSKDVRLSLKNKDWTDFAGYFHPEEGVRFSPYGNIDTSSDLIFTANTFLQDTGSTKKMVWGSYDGSGEPMSLSLKEYLDVFVYNADFLNPEKDSVNVFIGVGNSLNNLSSIYPGLPFTESYFSGFKKEYEGMDWSTLRLVFKPYQNKYYLVAVVHDQWTI